LRRQGKQRFKKKKRTKTRNKPTQSHSKKKKEREVKYYSENTDYIKRGQWKIKST